MFHPNGPTLRELTIQALSSTDRGYDLLAPKFDLTPFRTPDALLKVAAEIIREGGPVTDALDLCCGTGAALHHLRRLAQRQVVGVDRSRGMLDEAARQLRTVTKDAAEVTLLRGDALALPFVRRFDVVTCFGAFGHIPREDEPRLVHEVAQGLKVGGRFVFVTSDEPPRWHPAFWLATGFNWVMRVRNALLRPQFVMYYLTFLLPRARALLEAEGFELQVHRGVFPQPFSHALLVVATLRTPRSPA